MLIFIRELGKKEKFVLPKIPIAEEEKMLFLLLFLERDE